ncbi:hypothetical protein [Thalassobius sp. Cn5-15]|uniref:hypothetical protein n=1 Tax=Thalassobius sp. Cn5-15 TaxID=2917763 RepID=UPI001EF1C5A6|nr:hypothetical protein [Thalassobius sp. Cn5-15]MCG7493001.1 hypothetical protein [Thalassobius sp. Cn5-15]
MSGWGTPEQEADRRRMLAEETAAMLDGAAGNTHSHHRFKNPGSFLAGSMAARRDVHSGKTRAEAAIEWSVRLLGAAIFIGLFYLVTDSVDLIPW